MAECYTLTSCNPGNYPDIPDLAWDVRHPLEGNVVFVSVPFQGNPIDVNKLYTLTFDGTDTCEFIEWLPALQNTSFDNCTPTFGVFEYKDCESDERIVFGFTVADPTQAVLRIDGDCQCWDFIGEHSLPTVLLSTNFSEFDDCDECITDRQDNLCPIGERTLSFAVRVNLAQDPPAKRGFVDCVVKQKVLATSSNTLSYENDFTGTFFKRETPNTTCVFKLVDKNGAETLMDDDTLGEFLDFGGAAQPDLTYMIVEWRKVLLDIGLGTALSPYRIKQELNQAGVTKDLFSNHFFLQNFTIDAADLTVRMDATQTGLLVKENVDFSGTNFRTSLRFNGYFGNPKFSFEQDNLTKRDYSEEQVTMIINREYKMQGLNLQDCIVDELVFRILTGNEIFANDYNKNNPSYGVVRLPVVLEGNDGEEYFNRIRRPNLNLTFTDRVKNCRKLNC